MIRDHENTFCLNLSIANATTTDTIFTGGGDAVDQMYVFVNATTPISTASCTISIETSDTENFAAKTVLGTYPLSTGKGEKVKTRLPLGCKKYLRLAINKAEATTGTLTAYLAYDVNIQ